MAELRSPSSFRSWGFGHLGAGLAIGALIGFTLIGLAVMNSWWCFEEGGFHRASRSFTCADGCNTCTCGGVSTLKACAPPPRPWWQWW